MRPIKFRAWNKKEKKWHDRVLAGCNRDDDSYVCNMVWNEEKRDWSNFDEGCGTLVQFTGITGLGGVEIYERDVVKGFYYEGGRYHRFIGVVEFVAPSFEASGVKQYADRSFPLHGGVKVIGNAYEHPHLIEDGVDEIGSAFDNGKTITVLARNIGPYSPKLNLEPLDGDEK